jgi:hypothetical protein
VHRDIPIARGQLLTSQLALERRWKMPRRTVRDVLASFVARQMIVVKTAIGRRDGYSLITICNYDRFQGAGVEATDAPPAIIPAISPSQPRHFPATYKNGNNGEKKKSVCVVLSQEKEPPAYYAEGNQDDGFAAFWQVYPRKWDGHEAEARAAWQELRPDPALQEEILNAVEAWRDEWEVVGLRYAPPAARWLSERRWETAPLPDAPLMGMGNFDLTPPATAHKREEGSPPYVATVRPKIEPHRE